MAADVCDEAVMRWPAEAVEARDEVRRPPAAQHDPEQPLFSDRGRGVRGVSLREAGQLEQAAAVGIE